MATKREKGLCFNYDEKFVREHRCLYMLEVIKDEEDASQTDLGEAVEDEVPQVSLHTLTGICANWTMQLIVEVGATQLLALVDLGSTHNFIRDDLISQLGIEVQQRKDIKVTVANGEKVASARVT